MKKEALILLCWLAVMSLVLFVSMDADKSRAKRNARRIPEARLFLLALLGGAVGGTAGMYCFHHKTKHLKFALGFPIIAVLQMAAMVYLIINVL